MAERTAINIVANHFRFGIQSRSDVSPPADAFLAKTCASELDEDDAARTDTTLGGVLSTEAFCEANESKAEGQGSRASALTVARFDAPSAKKAPPPRCNAPSAPACFNNGEEHPCGIDRSNDNTCVASPSEKEARLSILSVKPPTSMKPPYVFAAMSRRTGFDVVSVMGTDAPGA